MAGMALSDLSEFGKRVAALFAKALVGIGRGDADWTILENGDGVNVRLAVATSDDEPLIFGLDEFRVLRISDEAIENRIRRYQDVVLRR